MTHTPQVPHTHYLARRYNTRERWASYGHQIDLMTRRNPETVLEVGPGNHTVAEALKKRGLRVTTLDIAPDVEPDVVGSVTDLPFPDRSYDAVAACEVLEHIPFSEFSRALDEIRRVSRRFSLISLPHAGWVFSISFKIPLLPLVSILWKLPFFWRRHEFGGEHYWELGKRGYSVRRIKHIFAARGFIVREARRYADDPAHYFFVLERAS